jgi:hypothetical protein
MALQRTADDVICHDHPHLLVIFSHNKCTSGSNAGKSILASWNPADLILLILEDKTGNV